MIFFIQYCIWVYYILYYVYRLYCDSDNVQSPGSRPAQIGNRSCQYIRLESSGHYSLLGCWLEGESRSSSLQKFARARHSVRKQVAPRFKNGQLLKLQIHLESCTPGQDQAKWYKPVHTSTYLYNMVQVSTRFPLWYKTVCHGTSTY